MRKILSVALIVISSLLACAQEVPQKILDNYLAIAAKSGEVLEKSFLPDFSRPHPTQMFRSMPCFPGKKIMVSVLTAAKPSDLILKVNYGKQEFKPKTVDYLELKLGSSNTYWLRTMVLDMANVTTNSDYCMEVYAYDANNIDLPVYLYFFSFK